MKPKQLLQNFQTEEPKPAEKPVKQPKPIEPAEKPGIRQYDPAKEFASKQAPQAQEQKPYKTIGDTEHYITPYDDFAKAILGPKANFTIRSKKAGQDFDLGSGSGLDFETEEEARKTIDEWESQRKAPQQPKQPKMKQGSPREIINSLGEEERIGGLTKADREKYYQRIFDKYDNDESFGGKERKYSKGGLSDIFHGESYGEEERKAMAPDYDESRFGEDSEKMFDEFAEYAKARGWKDEKGEEAPQQPQEAPQQAQEEFRPTEPIKDFQSGAKTDSEQEFLLEASNDRGMYDFIVENRDYLYRKANVDPQGAINDIVRHGSKRSDFYGIEPQNIRKSWLMDVLGGFYEDEGGAPDLTKQEEFTPSDKIEEFNDYYGAKTASERDLNLLTGNDQGAYYYVLQNRDALAKEAQYDPATALRRILSHASNRAWARDIKGDSIRKEYLINVIKGIIED